MANGLAGRTARSALLVRATGVDDTPQIGSTSGEV